MSDDDKIWPKKGDRLVHTSRKTGATYEALVVDVDKKSGKVQVRVGNITYPSLSTAATSLLGSPTNGWIYWGLKKQRSKRN